MKKWRSVLLPLFAMLVSGCTPLTLSEVLNPVNNESSIITSYSDSLTSEVNDSSLAENSTSEVTSSESEIEGSESSSEIDPAQMWSVDDDFTWQSYAYDENGYDIPHYIPGENPYAHIVTDADKEEFYANNYQRATSYEDAMFRTEQGLIAGDIIDTPSSATYPLNHLPNRTYRSLANYRINEGEYEYTPSGDYKSYTINNLNGKVKKVYYGAAYVALDDVAAYLFAFGEAPANQMSAKSGTAMAQAIALYGKYGRVNNGYYSSDVTQYKYEPALPHTDNGGAVEADMYNYREMDFGYTYTPWGYGVESNEPYNNGTKITRSTVRFVYSAYDHEGNEGAKYIPVEHRHVFLTINHYNDFFEYLNYEGGWSESFGWMSAGNEYCAGMSGSKYGKGYYDFENPEPPTNYIVPQIKTLAEVQSLFNSL
ncbi:MAG: hypothetical protein BWX57_00522 [Tenericutes bacterium ADurb.Bin024]|nr:MAG: hypothetical protein BWX57_00522 [Tenericutes bacterium ADurb.Bin024]